MDDKSACKVFSGGESPRKFRRPGSFRITVTNPCRCEDVLHMDDGADLTSIIRLKPLKSEPDENGRERKRGRERERERERKRWDGRSSRFFGLLGMHNWINLNCNESTVLDRSRTRFSPGSLSIVVSSRYRAKNQRYRIVLRIQSNTRENNRKEDGRLNLLGCTARPIEYNNSFRLSS